MKPVTIIHLQNTHKAYFDQLKEIGDSVEIKHGLPHQVRNSVLRCMQRGETKFHLVTKTIDGKLFVIAKDKIENWKGYKK